VNVLGVVVKKKNPLWALCMQSSCKSEGDRHAGRKQQESLLSVVMIIKTCAIKNIAWVSQ